MPDETTTTQEAAEQTPQPDEQQPTVFKPTKAQWQELLLTAQEAHGALLRLQGSIIAVVERQRRVYRTRAGSMGDLGYLSGLVGGAQAILRQALDFNTQPTFVGDKKFSELDQAEVKKRLGNIFDSIMVNALTVIASMSDTDIEPDVELTPEQQAVRDAITSLNPQASDA